MFSALYIGTPCYLSPKRSSGTPHLSIIADVAACRPKKSVISSRSRHACSRQVTPHNTHTIHVTARPERATAKASSHVPGIEEGRGGEGGREGAERRGEGSGRKNDYCASQSWLHTAKGFSYHEIGLKPSWALLILLRETIVNRTK